MEFRALSQSKSYADIEAALPSLRSSLALTQPVPHSFSEQPELKHSSSRVYKPPVKQNEDRPEVLDSRSYLAQATKGSRKKQADRDRRKKARREELKQQELKKEAKRASRAQVNSVSSSSSGSRESESVSDTTSNTETTEMIRSSSTVTVSTCISGTSSTETVEKSEDSNVLNS